MNIHFINTTTILPFTNKDLACYSNKISNEYTNKIQSVHCSHHGISGEHIDVFFVSEIELQEEKKNNRMRELGEDNIEDEALSMDLFGIYISKHPDYLRPIIKISPEKIYLYCLECKKENIDLNLRLIYKALLTVVIFHEVAHFIMDRDGRDERCPSSWFIDLHEENPTDTIIPRAHHHISSRPRHSTWCRLRNIVEESLANAIILKQRYNNLEKRFLRNFITKQPEGYCYAERWTMPQAKLLKVMDSWRSVKWEYERQDWLLTEPNNPISEIANKISLPASRIEEYNFNKEYH